MKKTTLTLVSLATATLFTCVQSLAAFRPPAVPLVTVDPYLSIWSFNDRLNEADTHHDINTLTHFGEALKVSYADPEGHDKLYRFMESIQEFFDLSSQVEVTI